MIEYVPHKLKDLYTVVREVLALEDAEIVIRFPKDSLLLTNKGDLEFLKSKLDASGKTYQLISDDPVGADLLNSLESGIQTDYDASAFAESAVDDTPQRFKVPSFTNLLNKAFVFLRSLFSLKRVGIRRSFFLVGLIMVLGLVGLYFGFERLKASRRATIVIMVQRESFARSLTVLVDAMLSKDLDVENKKFRGNQIEIVLSESTQVETTGSHLEGERAEGEITVYNRTTSDISLSKGTTVVYDADGTSLSFELRDSVDVPKVDYEDPDDPASTLIPGEASVEVRATDIGSAYNIAGGETLTFPDYDTNDLVAKSKDHFSGGFSKSIRVVAEDDVTEALHTVKVALESRISEELSNAVPSGYTYVPGSAKPIFGEPVLSAKVGDEVDTLDVKQSVTVKGLTYSSSLLRKLVFQLIASYVPEGYKLADSTLSLEANPLGNSNDTVLSDTQASLQVTVSSQVIPNIDTQALKQALRGVPLDSVDEVVSNFVTPTALSVQISPDVSFLHTLPDDTSNISVAVVAGD